MVVNTVAHFTNKNTHLNLIIAECGFKWNENIEHMSSYQCQQSLSTNVQLGCCFQSKYALLFNVVATYTHSANDMYFFKKLDLILFLLWHQQSPLSNLKIFSCLNFTICKMVLPKPSLKIGSVNKAFLF